MKQYLIRSVKYLIQLVVLLAVVFALMFATGTAALAPGDFFSEMFASVRGMTMLAALVILSFFYPRFGFVTRDLKGRLPENREQVVRAFALAGFVPVRESENQIVFRAASGVKKLLLLYEDTITVSSADGYLTLSGIRKETVKAEYRLKSFMPHEDER